MDVRTTLAFTRPRELARLYQFVVVVWTVSSPTAVSGLFPLCYGCQERLPTMKWIEVISIAKLVLVGRNTNPISYQS